MVYKVENGYKVTVYDHGYVTLCDYSPEKHTFTDCIFSTEREAIFQERRYYAFHRNTTDEEWEEIEKERIAIYGDNE